MATTPTTGDIPSNAAVDLKFNSEQFDRVMNSDDLTYTDRFGKKRITMKGVQELANGFQDAFTNLLGSPDGFKLIGGVKSFDTLRSTPVRTEGQRIFLKSYYENGNTGGGIFIGHIGTKLDDSGTVAQGINYYWERIFSGFVTPEMFGGDPTGTRPSGDAIRSAFAVSANLELNGTYSFEGQPLDRGGFHIKGNNSTIILSSGATFLKCTGTIYEITCKDINFLNGAGYFDFSAAVANSYTQSRIFDNLNMQGYTGTAIRLPNLDCPWWTIENCIFAGSTNLGTIGLWDNGSDNNIVRSNKFYKNQYHISTSPGSGTYLIESNDFGQFNTTGDGVNRANIWVRVPSTTPTFTGVTGMFLVSKNKFGNENETSLDVKLLLANVGGDGFPDYSSYSGGIRAVHFIFSQNYYAGNGTYPAYWMRSVGGWVPTTFSLEDENMMYASYYKSTYFCFIDNPTRTTPFSFFLKGKAFRDSNVLFRGRCSNDPMLSFSVIDPSMSVFSGDVKTHSPYPSGIGLGTTDITLNILPAITWAGTASVTSGVDSLGMGEAITASFTGRYGNLFQKLKPVSASEAGYMQGELKLADDSTFDRAIYFVHYSASTANTTQYYKFPLELVKGRWTSYCFPIMLVPNVDTHVIIISPSTQDTTSYPNKIVWSRSRVSKGRMPALLGCQRLGGLILDSVPTSSAGLPVGSVWCDVANGNVLKIVS